MSHYLSTYKTATRAQYMAGAVRAKVRLVTPPCPKLALSAQACEVTHGAQRQVGPLAQKSWLIRWMLACCGVQSKEAVRPNCFFSLGVKRDYKSEFSFPVRASFRWAKQSWAVTAVLENGVIRLPSVAGTECGISSGPVPQRQSSQSTQVKPLKDPQGLFNTGKKLQIGALVLRQPRRAFGLSDSASQTVVQRPDSPAMACASSGVL